MTTASLLLRLSGKSTDDNTGLDTQETDLRKLAADHGLDVVAVHIDDGKSGALRKRVGLLAWLEDAKSGRATHLLAWKLDRVSRGGHAALAVFLDVVAGVNADGEPVHAPVRFLSAKDGLDSESATWDIQVAVMGALAKSERDAMKTRIAAHREEVHATPDRVHGGSRPAWVKSVPRKGGGTTWIADPVKAGHVRWAADHLIDGGTFTSVCAEWTARGWEPVGAVWRPLAVRRIMSNPALYGVLTNGGIRRDADGVAIRNPALAVMSYTTWQRLQVAVKNRATVRQTTRNGRSTALLAGLLECASCGLVMYGHRAKGRIDTYRCRGGVDCPKPVSVSMARVDDVVIRFTLALVGGLVIAPEFMAVESVDAADLAAVEEAHKTVQGRLMSGTATPDDLASFNSLTSRLQELRDKVEAAEAALEAASTADMRTISERYADATTNAERRAVLAAGLPARIVVKPGERNGGIPLWERLSLPEAGEYAAELWREACEGPSAA